MKTPKTSGPTQLTNAAATIFTAAGSTKALIRSIIVTNVTGVAHTFTLSKGADASGTRFQASTALAANSTTYLYPGIELDAGEIIQGNADANTSVNVTINYDEYTVG